MTILMWKTSHYSNEIKRVECSRATDKSVWILEDHWKKGTVERRRDRSSSYDKFHESWIAAYDHLIQREERAVEYAQEQLERALKNQKKVFEIAKPKEA